MLKAERAGRETRIEASGSIAEIAADACEIIRVIYFALSVERREVFRACVELAMSHKDSPVWARPIRAEKTSVCSVNGELERQIDQLTRRGESGEEAGE